MQHFRYMRSARLAIIGLVPIQSVQSMDMYAWVVLMYAGPNCKCSHQQSLLHLVAP
jgi:hypothetical protein